MILTGFENTSISRVRVRDITKLLIFKVDDWYSTAHIVCERDRLATCKFEHMDGDIIWINIRDFDLIYNDDHYRMIRHKIQDALNRRQEVRDSFTQYQGKGYW